MRLTCPNCDAQYEVSADAIPPGGRDVQCSSCGHAWFQYPPEAEAAMAEEEALFEPPAPVAHDPVAHDPVVTAPEADAAPEPARVDTAGDTAPVVTQFDEDPDDNDAPIGFEPPAPLNRRPVDEAVLSVLREEAEREAEQRKTEAPRPLETQPDLGLDAAVPAMAAAGLSPVARRIAQLKGEDPDAPPPPPPGKPPKGRDLLPDIEEINSTLQPTEYPDEDDQAVTQNAAQPLKTGFRSGFLLMVLIAVGLVLAYVMAPRISEQMPGAADTMASYVATVDALRLWLDGLIQRATGALNRATGA